MEADSETPCFQKTMTHIMLQKNHSVLIPSSFIRTHGHMLDTVLSLTGPNGELRTVNIRKYSHVLGSGSTKLQCVLGPGWKEFVQENDFHVGDCVLFRLVGNSCFHVVLVSSKLQKNAVVKTTPLSKCEEERGLGKSGREDDGIIPQTKVARLHPKVKSDHRDQARPWRGILRNNVKEEAEIKHAQLESETGYVNHPGLEAAISSNSRFPQFTRKLSRSSVQSHGIRLEIPLRFAQEHGHKFQERVYLLGPNGQRRVVKIKLFSAFRTRIRVQFRVQFRDGWGAFSLENGFKEGDVLLFSLVEFSKFLVQVFPVATQ